MNVPAAHVRDIRAGITVEWLTVAWMTPEALISIVAGIAAGSVALIAFGIDSVIETVGERASVASHR